SPLNKEVLGWVREGTRPPGDPSHAHLWRVFWAMTGHSDPLFSFRSSAVPTMKDARRSGGMGWRCSYPQRAQAELVVMYLGLEAHTDSRSLVDAGESGCACK